MSAAYLRILGATQEECARGVGVSRRTFCRWEADAETWVAARQEATDRWLSDLTDASRATILTAVRKGDAASARWALERVEGGLPAPAAEVKHSGEVTITVVRRIVRAEPVEAAP